MWRTRITQNPCQIGPARGKSSANSGRVDAGKVMGSSKSRSATIARKKSATIARKPKRSKAPAPKVTIAPVDPVQAKIDALLSQQRVTMARAEISRELRCL